MLEAVVQSFPTHLFRCKWTVPLIVDLMQGPRRFADLVKSLGISRKVLSSKLSSLMVHGVVSVDEAGYRLTVKGLAIAELVKPLTSHVAPHVLAEVLKCKWSREILTTLRQGSLYSAELVAAINGLSWKIASDRLRKLCNHGLVEKTIHINQAPIRVQYSLTPRGKLLAAWLTTHIQHDAHNHSPQKKDARKPDICQTA
jgi:DNA-binding HxlR family transcriptional regulator